MAKEKNEKLSVTLQAKADFSQLINSLNKAYDEIKSKADKSDLFSIDKTLKQMNELQIKLQQSMEQGFSSPKELSQFQKIMNTLNKDAGDLTAKFQSIHIKGLQDELKEASKALKDIQAAYQKVQKEVERTIAAQMQGVKNNQEYAKRIAETQGDTKKLQEIEDSITDEINEQIQAQQRLREAKEETLEAEKKSLRSSENTKSNITTQTFLRAKDFKRVDGKQFEQSDWNAIKEGFKNITNSAKNSTSALNSFNKMLKTLGYEAENPETIAKRFMSLGHIFDKDSPLNKGIEESKNNIKDLEEEISDIGKLENKLANDKNIVSTTIHSNETTAELETYAEKTNEVTTAIQRKNKAEQESQSTNLIESIREANELLGEQKQNTEEVIDETSKIQESKQNFDNFTTSLQDAVKRVLSITTSWQIFRRLVRQTFEDVKEIDKAFAQIAMVTNYSVSDMWSRYSEYAAMANKLGQSTQSVIEASGLYYQQGLDTVEVMELTEETMKLATLAGLDFKDATAQMTAALRGFKLEMSEGERVTDVYAEVAAHAAATVNDLSQAMSATSNIAHSAGMSFENTTAMLATMIEATQEAPKNLGTALKTVIARFTELKENVAGTADSEFEDLDYNKVDKALKSVGVQLKDTSGQFRNLDDVFFELGKKWNSLDRNAQRYRIQSIPYVS